MQLSYSTLEKHREMQKKESYTSLELHDGKYIFALFFKWDNTAE